MNLENLLVAGGLVGKIGRLEGYAREVLPFVLERSYRYGRSSESAAEEAFNIAEVFEAERQKRLEREIEKLKGEGR